MRGSLWLSAMSGTLRCGMIRFAVGANVRCMLGVIYLSKTDFSTISVYLSEEPTLSVPTKEFRPWTSVKEAARALVGIIQNIAVAAIWVVIIGGGIILPLAILIWIIVKVVRKFKKSRR